MPAGKIKGKDNGGWAIKPFTGKDENSKQEVKILDRTINRLRGKR